jgi:hypothetical protein
LESPSVLSQLLAKANIPNGATDMAMIVCGFQVLCVFVDDSAEGYPSADARDGPPVIDLVSADQSFPFQKTIDFVPVAPLDGVSGELPESRFAALALSDLIESLATRDSLRSSVPTPVTFRPDETRDFDCDDEGRVLTSCRVLSIRDQPT